MKWSDIITYEAKTPQNIAMNPPKTVLIKNGWREIGKGAYASVFEHPNKNYVLKLFSSADTAYMDFVTFVKQHPNEHFPKFGNIVKLNEKYWTVKIETLQPITSNYKKELKIIGDVVALFKYRSYETIVKMIKDEDGYGRWQEFVTYLDKHPSMKDAISTLMPLFRKYFCDLGDSNFMLRGDVIVFTDPVETIR
jgi:signal peptidase I